MRKVLLIMLVSACCVFANQNAYKIKLNNRKDVSRITRLCSIESSGKNGELLVYADSAQLESIKPYLKSLSAPIAPPAVNFRTSKTLTDFMASWNSYPTYDVYAQYLNFMKDYSKGMIELDTVGYSVKKKPLVYMHFKNTTGRPKTQVMYSSTMHGNELTGFVLLAEFAEYLRTNYGTPGAEGVRVTKLLDSMDVWIMPLNNPDGAYPKTDTTVAYAQRNNKNNVDLNRDFPDQFIDKNNTKTGRQPETGAVMDFIQKHNFTLSANFHTGAVLVNYPWDGVESGIEGYELNDCPDSLWFKSVSKVYTASNPDMANSTEFKNGITNGAKWYAIYGGRQDWVYVYNQGRETTVELTNDGVLAPDELVRQWTINKESLLAYFEQAGKGIHGIVRNDKGEPLFAQIRLKEIPETDVKTDSTTGYFARLTYPGIYNIEISSPGYNKYEIKNFDFKSIDYKFLEITLSNEKSDVRTGDLASNYNVEFNSGVFNFDNMNEEATISIYDMVGANVSYLTKPLGFDYIRFSNYSSLTPGVYFAVIRSNNYVKSIKIIK